MIPLLKPSIEETVSSFRIKPTENVYLKYGNFINLISFKHIHSLPKDLVFFFKCLR